jgi:hypothetical protein
LWEVEARRLLKRFQLAGKKEDIEVIANTISCGGVVLEGGRRVFERKEALNVAGYHKTQS